MSHSRLVIASAALGGVVLSVIAVIYFVQPAHALPGFFPGHVGAHDAEAGAHHVKHGLVALVLAFVCFVLAWFGSGPSAAQQPEH